MRKIILNSLLLMLTFAVFGHGDGKYADSNLLKEMQAGDKAAILMVYFGSTHDDTRELTIDALNSKVKDVFSDIEVREAYTSRIVIKRLGERGIEKQNPTNALKQLADEGYTHILVQTTTIINGVEMESLIRNVAEMSTLFKEIRLGEPLLSSPKDYEKVIAALTKEYDKSKAYVWVGHGTYDVSTAQYAMLDYMLKAKGHTNCFVGTVEGYPAYEDALAQLEASGLKEVTLIPFMFVAGDHAKNDIDGDWKDDLEKAGFKVTTELKGLGEHPLVQEIYISHLKFILHHKKIDIIEKKAIYEKTGEVGHAH